MLNIKNNAPLNAADRLKYVKQLLQIERDEDYRLYQELFLRINLEQRKKNKWGKTSSLSDMQSSMYVRF